MVASVGLDAVLRIDQKPLLAKTAARATWCAMNDLLGGSM